MDFCSFWIMMFILMSLLSWDFGINFWVFILWYLGFMIVLCIWDCRFVEVNLELVLDVFDLEEVFVFLCFEYILLLRFVMMVMLGLIKVVGDFGIFFCVRFEFIMLVLFIGRRCWFVLCWSFKWLFVFLLD